MLVKKSSLRGLSVLVRSSFLFALFLFPISFESVAQCDPNSPYDKIVSGFHQSIALKSAGGFAVWGENMDRTGTGDVLTPIDLNVTNYPALVGMPLKATIGGGGSPSTEQAILLTSDGLYAWGSEGNVLANSLTASAAFAKVTVGAFDGATTNASTGLPSGVSPGDVVSMTASNQTLTILTSSGNVWVLSQISGNLYGNGTAVNTIVSNKWQKVKTNASTDLTDVTAVRVQASTSSLNAFIALTSTGLVYTWGSSVYLGDGNGVVAKNYATSMTIPVEFSSNNVPKMIGVTGGTYNVSTVYNSFYLLSNGGTLYVLGENGQRQLGTFDQVDALTWTQAERVNGTPFTNINFISVQEHDDSAPGVSAITTTGDLYTWGENEGLMLGRAVEADFYNPGMPNGFTSGTDVAISSELGGHTLVYLKQGTTRFCYVGHKTAGSMGDGVSQGSFISTFDCAATPSLSICGSVPVAGSTLTSTITASLRSILADGSTTSTITVQLKTSAGVNLTSSGGNVAIFTSAGTLGTVTNNNDGTYTVILTSGASAATASITYTLNGNSGTNTESVAFTSVANTPPTITAVANQNVVGTASTGALAVTVGDAETSVGSLTVTAASSDLTLIPTANIQLGGSGANRTVTVSAASGQTGTATITLTVTDAGSLTATSSFTITVTAGNTPPTITTVANQNVVGTASTGALAVTVGDAETSAGSLTLTAASSDVTLIPTANIQLGGSGANRTVTVSAASGQTGTATITLTVADAGSLTATSSFTITVTAGNTPPTITTVANQNVVGTASTGALAVTVGDAETAAGSLTLTVTSTNVALIPLANIILGGSGANRTVAANALIDQTGTSTITLTITDGGNLTATSSFTITVSADNSDTDGDGVSDAQERIDGTSPTSGCDFKKASQNLSAVSAFWKSSDCDNDGISNFLETNGGTNNADFDGDGILNMFDPDSDQDGINDSYEKNIDSDGDGDADYLDLDSDNDGILDSREMIGDMDRDGIPNYKDLDSDGDGILDVIEATENFRAAVDRNGDGRVDAGTTDANANGWPDAVDSFIGARALAIPDTDRDGAPDFLDLDADGDGILDAIEGAGDPDRDNIANYRDRDSDGDWLGDGIEGRNDADGDGIPNYLDLDSDGDTISDSWEGANRCVACTNLQDDQGDGWDDRKQFPNPLAIDTDKDGTPDFLDLDSDNDCILDRQELGADMDGDDMPNFRDEDSDNDGISDQVEAVVCGAPIDTDNDGKPDFEDLDSDNDGITDKIEGVVDTDGDGLPDYRDLDSDNDGISDAIEGVVDTDGDGLPDFRDLDSDNDGIPDAVEKGKDGNAPSDTDGDGISDYRDVDSDNDGIPDAIEKGKDGNNPVDTDGDGTPDYRDLDSDNDGIPDAIEAGKDANNPTDTDGDGIPDYRDLDSDNDGIPDAIEAGKDPINPSDADGDGIYDFRDLDSDNDTISDKVEAGADPKKPVDTDLDGVFDFRDLDSDNDSIPDAVEGVVDTDGDAKPDYQDIDSDGDGLSDRIEAGPNPRVPVDTDRDGRPDYRDLDSDNDGLLDREEMGPNPLSPLDTDKDGIFDFRDTDSDNDGILDVNEDDLSLGNILDCDKDGIPNRLDADRCPSVAPQGISPNGDGKNDVLAIPGLLATPGPNRLTIFNRWGNIVYESADYKNTWGGQTDRAFELLATDGLLPDGTYYYILDYQDRKPTLKAYIYINRIDK